MKYNNVCPEENISPEKNSSRNKSATESPSPVSYLKHSNSQEAKKTRKIFTQKLDLQSEIAFPSLQSTPKKEIPKKRRINPTQLFNSPQEQSKPSPKHGTCLQPSPQSLRNPFNQAKEQVAQNNLDQERALLKEHKQQITLLPAQDSVSNVPKSWSFTEPLPSLVTRKRLLDRLSTLFSFCLSNNLVPSLYLEIKFLIGLILIRVCPETYQPSNGCLSSVHNCVYFGVKTLEKLKDFWSHADHSTLRLLFKNTRIVHFSSGWTEQLLKITHVGEVFQSNKKFSSQHSIGNVSFQSDTDNRFNFASDRSFHVFRKQRDQFCEVWQIWKENNSSVDWKMSTSLQKMIQSLVDLKCDCVNYVHLARLFRSQLLNVAQLVDVKEESGPLGLLQNADPEKLRRLKERLVNPTENRFKENAIFEGDQEFFRDFIVLANSPAFNEHLKNSLASGIEELSLTSIDSDDCDGYAHFAEALISLQVMSKFLAFLTFLPYGSVDHLPEHIFHDLSQLRSSQKFPIDLFQHVYQAEQRGRLVLTLPWVVTYLSIADPVSLCLPASHSVLCFLVYIFRKRCSADELIPANAFFLSILLSWLFDRAHFPRSLLSKTNVELRSIIDAAAGKSNKSPAPSPSPDFCLDQYPLVDATLTYQCCPYLWTWKNLLLDFAHTNTKAGDRRLVSRKITPMSAEDPSQKMKQQTTSLQLSLEENFFHNQPSSVKRTVDFVSDRLASNVVRDVRHQVIPGLAARGQASVKSWPADSQRIDEKLESLSDQLCFDVRARTSELAVSGTASLDVILESLLPNDILPQVRCVCVAIATKLTRAKILDWMDRHVTIGQYRNYFEFAFVFVLFLSSPDSSLGSTFVFNSSFTFESIII